MIESIGIDSTIPTGGICPRCERTPLVTDGERKYCPECLMHVDEKEAEKNGKKDPKEPDLCPFCHEELFHIIRKNVLYCATCDKDYPIAPKEGKKNTCIIRY